jgi:hypothetical protein
MAERRYIKAESTVLAFIATLAVMCKFECVVGTMDSQLLNGIYKLYHAFNIDNLADCLVFVLFCCVIWYVLKYYGKFEVWTFGGSLLLAVVYVVSMSYKNYNGMDFLLIDKFQTLLSLVCIIGYTIMIYFIIKIIEIIIDKNDENYGSERIANKYRNIFWVSFAIIFVCWFPWIFLNYPGSVDADSNYQLTQYFGYSDFTSHHPPLNTFIRGSLVELGRLIYNANLGVFFYVLLQTVLGVIICSLSIKKLSEFGIKWKYCIIGILFFALPIWGGVAQSCEKDFLYSQSILLFCICLLDIVKNKECTLKNAIYILSVGILASLLRQNGIFSVVPTIIVISLWLKNIDKKRMCIVVVLTLLVYGTIVRIVYPMLGIKNGSISEALSMPFSQTARYVNSYSDEVTEYEKEVISSVIEYESLMDYDPKSTDSIKATYKGDDSMLPEYFKVWFRMFLKHPGCYVSAFMNKAAGYIAPVYTCWPAILTDEIEPFYSELEVTHPFGDKFIEYARGLEYLNIYLPLFNLTCSPGAYTWIVVICIMLLVRKKVYKGIIVFMPLIMNILVCIAAPIWESRYAMPVMISLPLMIGWTWYMLKENKWMGISKI